MIWSLVGIKKMMPILVVALLLLGIIVYVNVFSSQPNSQALTETEMEKLVAQKAKEFFKALYGVDWNYKITLEELDIELVKETIKQHKIYKVSGYFRKDVPSIYLAVNYKGDVMILPKDFNSMIKNEDIELPTDVLSLVKVYVIVAIKDSGLINNEVLFLSDANEIPWDQKYGGKDPKDFSNLVIPPQFSQINGRYRAELFSWTKLKGILEHWVFIVEKNRLQLVKRESIAELIGNFESIE